MMASSKKRVAIIGAGVSGLISAVNMQKVGLEPVIFDKKSNLGGMWNTDLEPCWSSMRTNITKFSTAVADFAWPKDAPLFPNQQQVYLYLTSYAQQLLSPDVFRFNTEVIQITYSTEKWTVQYHTKPDNTSSEQFHFVIIASGFFGSPYKPKNISGLSSFPGTLIHSGDYRSPEQVRDKRVVIVGGSMSAAEIAADMATSAKHITHIVPHSFWSLPRFIPLTPADPATSFLPIDLVLFRRSKRTTNHEILRNRDDYKKLNAYARSITGNTQASARLTDDDDDDDEKPIYYAITDTYAQWNRGGKIDLQQGRLDKVEGDGTLTLNNGTTIKTTEDDILILCTGYRPNLNFFSKDILEQISYQSDDLFCPVILHRSIFHPALPNLAFIGMYRGLFWTIIELQSRWVAATFSGRLSTPSIALQQQGLIMEHRIRAQQPRPQFPHSDFVGLADDLAKETSAATASTTSDIVVPTQYRTNGPDQSVVDEINSVCDEAKKGRFVAGAVFRALYQSQWTFERTINGKPSDAIVHGRAQFNFSAQHELLYQEQGQLTLPSQSPLDITQKYLYVNNEDQDFLAVYFVDQQNKRGSLFHTISFQSRQSSENGWRATGEHLCSEDYYRTSYFFSFNGISLSHFEITYSVNGPSKDYISKTIFHSE